MSDEELSFGPVALKAPLASYGGFVWGVLVLYSPAGGLHPSAPGRIIIPAPGMGNRPWGLGISHALAVIPFANCESVTYEDLTYWPAVLALIDNGMVISNGNGIGGKVVKPPFVKEKVRNITVAALLAAGVPPCMVDNREELHYNG